MRAWHFLSATGRLRDGREPPPDGEWLTHDGPCVMCESGLHASRRVTDALRFAPGPVLCRVELAGVAAEDTDKLVARRRKILWRLNASAALRAFARRCALDVASEWDPPPLVLEYLRTGSELSRSAAERAASSAMWRAASSAAESAAERVAERAASSFAWRAASSAAERAAERAASSSARRAERSRQEKLLLSFVREARAGRTEWRFR